MAGNIKRTTPNYALRIPVFDSPGWGREVERNFDILDSALFAATGLAVTSGLWTNSTTYIMGERVVDPDLGGVYACLVGHTSAATGTFAADRIANPTYWEAYDTTIIWRGDWANATQYFVNDIIQDGYKFGIAIANFTSDTSYANDVSDGNIVTFFDGTGTVTDSTNAKNAAEAAQLAAENAQAASESARDTSVSSKNDAVIAKDAAEDAQVAAEAAAIQAANTVANSTTGAVRVDTIQTHSNDEKQQGRTNIDIPKYVIPIPGGRLGTVSGDPTDEASSVATLYYTPYLHNQIFLYDGTSAWELHEFAECSLSVAALGDGVYDVFLYDNAGTLTLDTVAWTNTTTRATALVRQDGVWVLTGATNKRYLGTIAVVAGTVSDGDKIRDVWNMYNRINRRVWVYDGTTSWTYTTNAWRTARANPANRAYITKGLEEDFVDVIMKGLAGTSTATMRLAGMGVALNGNTPSTRNHQTLAVDAVGNTSKPLNASYREVMPLGRNYLGWVEVAAGLDTQTFQGTEGYGFLGYTLQ